MATAVSRAVAEALAEQQRKHVDELARAEDRAREEALTSELDARRAELEIESDAKLAALTARHAEQLRDATTVALGAENASADSVAAERKRAADLEKENFRLSQRLRDREQARKG